MRTRLQALKESVLTGFWFLPATAVLLAIGLALLLVEVDRALADGFGRFTFGAGPDGAREVLSAITSSMITFTGLVFSITIVVLQLTSSQFSPRVLRTFLRDRYTQISLSAFVATFVYAVMVLRTVNSNSESERFTPALATTFGVALLLISVGVFVGYIHHIATAIQVSSIVQAIGRETRGTLERVAPAEPAEPSERDAADRPREPLAAPPVRRLAARRSGNLNSVDTARLTALARSAGMVLVVREPVGAYVPEGMLLVDVHPDGRRPRSEDGAPEPPEAELDERAVLAAVGLGKVRTPGEDVAFGLRQLVDIAEKALSPGINDPTTAVQALDELHDVLRRIVSRPMPSGDTVDEDGVLRVRRPEPSARDFLALALDEVEQYGADSLQVDQRLERMLQDLLEAARPEHRAAVLERLHRRGRRADRPTG